MELDVDVLHQRCKDVEIWVDMRAEITLNLKLIKKYNLVSFTGS